MADEPTDRGSDVGTSRRALRDVTAIRFDAFETKYLKKKAVEDKMRSAMSLLDLPFSQIRQYKPPKAPFTFQITITFGFGQILLNF